MSIKQLNKFIDEKKPWKAIQTAIKTDKKLKEMFGISLDEASDLSSKEQIKLYEDINK